MLLASALLALSVMAPTESCASECAAQAGTDRQTCLLQCEQQETPRSGTGMTRWHRQENLGGAPPDSPHAGEDETVVTTTTTTAEGTSTTTTTSTSGATTKSGAAAKPASVRAASAKRGGEDYPALAKCMNGCDPDSVAHTRAQCKLGCLRLSVHWRARG
ncbi:MAG TPA: hypothetical protein VG755_39850 [Nannocystaceae bacterium]|nr:hypothetical protein [Nannocystaceae bacterium]